MMVFGTSPDAGNNLSRDKVGTNSSNEAKHRSPTVKTLSEIHKTKFDFFGAHGIKAKSFLQ